MDFLLFFPIFTIGIKAKLNELESESDIFPQTEGEVGKSELTPVVKALTNCALSDDEYIWSISSLNFPTTKCLFTWAEYCEDFTQVVICEKNVVKSL